MKLLKTEGTSLARPICAFFGKCSFGRLKKLFKVFKKVVIKLKKYMSCCPALSVFRNIPPAIRNFPASADGVSVPMESL